MYAFSPLIGRFCDKQGRLLAITVGSCFLVCSSVLAALAGESAVLIFPALWMLGIGWSFGLIGGSSLLVDSVPTEARVSVQGAADLLMSLCGGLAGFSSGFVRKAVGFHMLSNFAAVLAVVLVVIATRALGRERTSVVSGSV
jgi:MFS family permease